MRALLLVLLVFAPHRAAAMGEADPLLASVRIDRLERDLGAAAPRWLTEVEGWLGRDRDKLWLDLDAERDVAHLEELEIQVRYGRAIAPYWDLRAGLRQDLHPAPERTALALGVKGLAPYWVETDANLYWYENGLVGLEAELEHELLFTQRLALAGRVETGWFGRSDAASGRGGGLDRVEAGLYLRYHLRREFAPYLGFTAHRRFGNGADFARATGEVATDLRLVLGLHAWW